MAPPPLSGHSLQDMPVAGVGERQGDEGPCRDEVAVSEDEAYQRRAHDASPSTSSANYPKATGQMHVREDAEDEIAASPGMVRGGCDGGVGKETGGDGWAAKEGVWDEVQAAVEGIEHVVRGSTEYAIWAQAATAQLEQFAAAVGEGHLRAEQAARALEVLCGRLRMAVKEEGDCSGQMSTSSIPYSRRVGGAGAGGGGKCGDNEEGRDGSASYSGPQRGWTDDNEDMSMEEEIQDRMAWPSQGAKADEAGLQGTEIDRSHRRVSAREQGQKQQSDSLEEAMFKVSASIFELHVSYIF